MRKLDNKGFTLVEVLATLVILVVIMSIAIPNISSSLERSKGKQDDARLDVLKSYAELYVADYKNSVYSNIGTSDGCYIKIESLKGDYASEDEVKDSDGNEFDGAFVFIKSDNSYHYVEGDDTSYEYNGSTYGVSCVS